MTNAVALNSLSFNVSRTLGQALFGVVAVLGIRLLAGGDSTNIARLALPFYLNVASFGAVLYVLATLPFPARPGLRRGKVGDDIREGLRYVRATPPVRNVMLLVGLMSLTVINFNVIIPYFARVVYGEREAAFGLLSAFFGVGAMGGALWQASKPNPVRNLRYGAVTLIVSTMALALTPGSVLARAGAGGLWIRDAYAAGQRRQHRAADHPRPPARARDEPVLFVLVGMDRLARCCRAP